MYLNYDRESTYREFHIVIADGTNDLEKNAVLRFIATKSPPFLRL